MKGESPAKANSRWEGSEQEGRAHRGKCEGAQGGQQVHRRAPKDLARPSKAAVPKLSGTGS